MKPVMEAKVTYGFWGIICGAGIAMIVGFTWGGWTTAGTTQRMNEEAVLASRAAICAAQFMNAPNHELNVKEFQGTANYIRSRIIEKGGWDKMPGQEKAGWRVAGPCVTRIDALLEAAENVSVSVK